MFFGEGRFIAIEASDGASLIAALANAHGATHIPLGITRVPVVEFVYVRFSENLSRAPRGGFQMKPPGDWALRKLFLGKNEDEEEGQVFLAVNAISRKAEFLIKDADYGDDVLQYLAPVL